MSLLERKGRFITSALLLLIAIPPSWVIAAPQQALPTSREQDQQNKIYQDAMIKRALNEARRSPEGLVDEPDQTVEPAGIRGGPSFMINHIEVDTGLFPADAVEVDDILQRYTGRKLDGTDVFYLVRDITNRYSGKGFSTTAVKVIPGNMKSGLLTLVIDWGLVEGWLVNGNAPSSIAEKMMTFQAMPGVIGKPLNIFDLDQAIENLNNGAKRATIDVVPSERAGYSLLNIVTTPSKANTVSLGMNNSGVNSPSNGRYQYVLTSSLNDLLLGNDSLSVYGNGRRFKDDEHKSEYSAGVNYSFPVGYSLVELRYSDSYYSNILSGNFGDYSTHGDSQTYDIKLSHTLWRDTNTKLSAYSQLERKESANYLEDTYLEASSLRYNALTMGLQMVNKLQGGVLYGDWSLTQGLSAFGGSDAAFKKNGKPTNVRLFAFNTAWSGGLQLYDRDFEYAMHVGGQYAKDSTVTTYKQGIGDEYTVRGFQGPALWGDRAIFVNNTITLPIQTNYGNFAPFVGLDAGYVDEIYEEPGYAEDATIAGASIGTRLNWPHAMLGFTLSRPLLIPDFIRSNTSPYITYVNVSIFY
ncbi:MULTISPECIES: ShlB/FhaC/HecB family hemolysin secretion/activation protein [unclassified Pseudomonas]|uniref:ShlB/FhaC/HecB family hemolysin secretion/activation protein n=2 Tax=Pseudomonas TaxID=286 RepID=UPI0015A808F4|nr:MULTISPECIES: ShlB/FhaC/HecB family hemolysin secretion/activation protein [unclassified Pseudomonas]